MHEVKELLRRREISAGKLTKPIDIIHLQVFQRWGWVREDEKKPSKKIENVTSSRQASASRPDP
jgi:hypothetical protein